MSSPPPHSDSEPAGPHSLRRRVITALVLAPPVLVAVILGPPWSDLLLLALACGMAWEWARVCARHEPLGGAEIITVAAAPLVLFAAMIGGAAAMAVAGVTAALALALAVRRKPASALRLRWLMGGLLYVTLPLVLLRWLRGEEADGRDLVLWLLLVIWAADTGGYLFGKAIGGPKLLPRISPKKTWAGLAGGVALASMIGSLFALWLEQPPIALLTLLAALLAVVGQAGDLLESAFKRHFGVKDASGLIPGHGGLLDRMDALMAATLPMAVLVYIGMFG